MNVNKSKTEYKDFLPLNAEEMKKRGWDRPDFVVVTGDAYVDHPSFGTAIIARVTEREGFRVCIMSQPMSDSDYTQFGKPRYAFLIGSGNVDSMVSNYSVAKIKRKKDDYSPGGQTGRRPDRALTVYCHKIRSFYPDTPQIIGGIEASLRRFAHYDYWADKVLPSILVSSGADLLSFGMGERQNVEIINRLASGEPIQSIRDVRGTCFLCKPEDIPVGIINLPSFEIVSSDKKQYAKAEMLAHREHDAIRGRTLLQKHGKQIVIQNPPAIPLDEKELDAVYDLPFMNMPHPVYEKMGGIPGFSEVQFSIAHNRGCFGGCNFCSISYHQGRYVTSRSKESIIRQAKDMVKSPDFKGYIHDVGGPTANFRHPSCDKQLKNGLCADRRCLAPTPCPALKVDHSEYLDILREIRRIDGIKKVFIRSGIRYDYLLLDENREFLNELVKYHVSGQLKVAPEHCASEVLDRMSKPHIETYNEFSKLFYEECGLVGKEEYLIPYLMSSHPGSTLSDAVELAVYLHDNKIRPEQVQDFYPTPGTLSTAMYYTGLDPETMKSVYVAKTPKEKALQRSLLQYFMPQSVDKAREALRIAGRYDLIGNGPNCLVPSEKSVAANKAYGEKGKTGSKTMRMKYKNRNKDKDSKKR